MNSLLLALAGARREILEWCPSERAKFQSLGWAILITSGVATVSMWFALTSAMGFNPILAVPIALMWGLVIMVIDRWVITSMPFDGSRPLAMAVPRLILALLLGALISAPIVLRVFQSEINAQVYVIKEERLSVFITDQQHSQLGKQVIYWQEDVANLQKVIDSKGQVALNPSIDPLVQSLTRQRAAEQAREHQYYQQWQCQLYGGSECTVKGNQPLAQASEESYDQAAAQVAELTNQIQQRERQLSATDAASKRARYQVAQSSLPGAKQQLSAVQDRQNELRQSFDALNQATNGLLIRLQALNQLSSEVLTVNIARFLLFLLFLVIECLPVTVKLLQGPGLYEKVLQAAADREIREAREAWRARSWTKAETMTAAQVTATALAGPDSPYALDAGLRYLVERGTQAAPELIGASTQSLQDKALIDDSEECVPLEEGEFSKMGDIGTHSASARQNAGSGRHASSIDLRYSDDDL